MKGISCKLVLWILTLFTAAIISLTPGRAEEKYPSRPISVVVGYAAGGATDIITRALIEPAKEILGVPIVVLNKPGGGTAIAMETVKTSKPNGYTIGMSTTASLAATRLGQANYDFFSDFTHICHVTRWTSAFGVSASSPWKTFQEFQSYAKAHPGEVKFGAAGRGSTGQLSAESLAAEAGIKIVHLPTQADHEITTSILGGHIQAGCTTYYGWGEQVKAGKIRLLVVVADERAKGWPEVPTGKELGFNIGGKGPVGIVGPKGLPQEVVKTLADAFKRSTEDPRFIKFMNSIYTPVEYKSSEEFTRELLEYDKWSVNIMKRIGMIN